MIGRRDSGRRTPERQTPAEGEGSATAGRVPLKRREVLATVGAVLATPAAASGARAADATEDGGSGDRGYGAGRYGDGPYGDPPEDGTEEPLLAVETLDASSVDASSATVVGEVSALSGYEEGTVYFEWGEKGAPTNTTDEQTLASPAEFDAELTNLESGVEYEFRAVAEAGDVSVRGDSLSFTTAEADTPDAVPRIGRLTARDTSNPRNPHAKASIEWAASLEDGELRSAELTVSDRTGEVRSWQYDLSGRSAVRSETERIHKGGGERYTVELTVDSDHGTSESKQATFNAP